VQCIIFKNINRDVLRYLLLDKYNKLYYNNAAGYKYIYFGQKLLNFECVNSNF